MRLGDEPRRVRWPAPRPARGDMLVWGTRRSASGGPDVERDLLVGTGTSRCTSGVAVMDPTNLRMRDDLARLRRLNRPTIRGVAIQPTMGSRNVVIRRVAAKHS